MSTIGKSTGTSSNRKTSSVKRTSQTKQSKAPKPTSQSKAPSDRVKLSGEKGGPNKSPIDFSQSSAAKSPAKLDLKGGVMKQGAQGDQVKQLKKLGKEHIDFRVVDTGGAFTNKGTGRIDIATANRKDSLDPTVNGPLTLKFQD